MTSPIERWTLFPVTKGAKIPAGPWGHLAPGAKTHTKDQDIGLATGEKSGVFVVDLDRKNGKDGLATIQAMGELPKTLATVTPSGGVHLYFRHPGFPVKTSVEELGPGVDIRGEGGYAVVYPFVDEAVPIADAPPWLLDRVRKGARPPPTTAIESGGRNDALTRLAGAMRRHGADEATILAALRERNRSCTPPLPENEVSTIAASVAKYDPTLVGTPTEGFVPLSFDEMSAPVPDPKWHVEALGIAPGRPCQLLGMGFSGKTIVSLSAAISTACGLPLWGSLGVRHGPVGWIDYEMGRNPLLRRMRRLASGLDVPWGDVVPNFKFVSLPRTKLNSDDAEEHLVRFADGLTACWVDSLRRSVPGVEENDSDISRWIDQMLHASERTGCTFWFLHHSTTKTKYLEGQDQRGAGRGSSAIYDASGTVLSLSGKANEPMLVTQTRSGEGEGRAADFTLQIQDTEDKAGLVVTYAALEAAEKERPLDDLVLEAVKGYNFKGEASTNSQLLATSLGKRRVDVVGVLSQLTERGLMTNLGSTSKPRYWALGPDGRLWTPSHTVPTVGR